MRDIEQALSLNGNLIERVVSLFAIDYSIMHILPFLINTDVAPV